MGNYDRWSTPKQIKIERAGESKKKNRGVLKKGERKKGRKARLDEVLSARNEARRYFQWMEDEKERRRSHPEWYMKTRQSGKGWEPKWQERYQQAFDKHSKLLRKCVQDAIIAFDESQEYLI